MTNFRQAVIWMVLFGFMIGMLLVLDVRSDRRVEVTIGPSGVEVHPWRASTIRATVVESVDWEAVPRNHVMPMRVTIDESLNAGVVSDLLNYCAMYGHFDPTWRIGDGVETVYEFLGCSCGGGTVWPEDSAEDLSVTEVRRKRICYVNLTVTPDGIFLNDMPMTPTELENAIDTAAGNRPIDQGYMMLTIDLETELRSMKELMALIARDDWKYQMAFPEEYL